MKKNIKYSFTLLAVFVLNTFQAFADEPNPSEPPEDVPGAPIDSGLWILFLVAIAFGIITTAKAIRSKTISIN